MAVAWITEVCNGYGKIKFFQPDKKWNPEFFGQKFEAGKEFLLYCTKWKDFVIPWAEKGTLKIDTSYNYRCYVGPTAGDPNNDYLHVESSQLPYWTEFLGPKGEGNNFCFRLTIEKDGKIKFEKITC